MEILLFLRLRKCPCDSHANAFLSRLRTRSRRFTASSNGSKVCCILCERIRYAGSCCGAVSLTQQLLVNSVLTDSGDSHTVSNTPDLFNFPPEEVFQPRSSRLFENAADVCLAATRPQDLIGNYDSSVRTRFGPLHDVATSTSCVCRPHVARTYSQSCRSSVKEKSQDTGLGGSNPRACSVVLHSSPREKAHVSENSTNAIIGSDG